MSYWRFCSDSSSIQKFTSRLQAQAKYFVFFACVMSICSMLGCQSQSQFKAPVSKPGELGGPLAGLNSEQLQKFDSAKALFEKEFTPEEGLGPLFKDRSCYRCHGFPGVVGGEGRDLSSTSILAFAKRITGSEKAKKPLQEVITGLTKRDVDFFLLRGGPTLQTRSVTTEFPEKFPADVQMNFEMLPVDAELQSNRHAQHLWGAGLIDNIADGDIVNNALEESVAHPKLAGRSISAVDRFTEQARAARFGWKNQNVSLLNFSATAMNTEMGLTTYLHHTENTPSYLGMMSQKLANMLPPPPNDDGKILLSLTYFQSLLGPPPRGKITPEVKKGEQIFQKLECAVCHKPDAKTVAVAKVPDPDSPLPGIRYLEVEALSGKTFHPYSDFLVHDMGWELADGIPQEGARGGEWRSPPLWGIGNRRFFLHDGRAKSIDEAVRLHAGQGKGAKDDYNALPSEDKQALLAFLQSL